MVDEKAEGAKVNAEMINDPFRFWCWISVSYLLVGWCISLTLPPKYDDSDSLFAIALLLWPFVIVFWIFFALQQLSIKVRDKIRK